MSRIRANTITNQNANGAPNFPDGITVSGVVTATTTSQNITGNLSVTGNIGVGGTITYEDVTNVDSVGVITARSGIRIGTGGTVGPSGAGIVTYFGDGSQLTGIDATQIATGNTKVQTVASRVDTKVDNVGILTVTAAGANVTGIITANSFIAGGAALANTPAFSAGPATAATGHADNTWARVSFTEIMDSDSKFNGTTFTPGVAGYYSYYANVYMRSENSTDVYSWHLTIRKNNSDQGNQGGSRYYSDNSDGDRLAPTISGIVYLDDNDYLECWAYANTTGSTWAVVGSNGSFGAFKLIGV